MVNSKTSNRNVVKLPKFISGLEGVTAGLQIFAGVVQIHGWMPSSHEVKFCIFKMQRALGYGEMINSCIVIG